MKRDPRGGLNDLEVKVLEFDCNISVENYLNQVQSIEKIFEPIEYNEEKPFKLVVLKMNGIHS